MSSSDWNVGKLRAWLAQFPDDTPVYKGDGSGCSECNPDGVDYYSEPYPEHSLRYVDGYSKPAVQAVTL